MFTIADAKTLLRNILRETPAKFYAGIFTIARDGIEDVTKDELPVLLAVVASEVRCEAPLRTLSARLNALATRYIAFEKAAGEAVGSRAESAGPVEDAEPLDGAEGAATAEGAEGAPPALSAVGADAAYGGPPADAEEAQVRALFAQAQPANQPRGGALSSSESAPQAPRAAIVPRAAEPSRKAPGASGAPTLKATPKKPAGAAPPAAKPEGTA